MDRMKNFGFLLKDVSRRYVLRFEQHAREISMTLMQCKVLVHLQKSEGASQARLAELTQMEPMTMVRILDRMEADKLLERRPDPSDRRARRLYLTRKAKPLLEETWRLAETTRNEMFAGISKADRESFMSVLERIYENACGLDGERPGKPDAPLGSSAAAKRTHGATRSTATSTK
jgi:MarR family transcriptional regulator, transcriptional regulator for hemolysin